MSGGLSPVLAQSAEGGAAGDDAGPMQLPTISVEGAASEGPYNPSQLSLPKLAVPLLDVPQSVTVIPRQLIEDRADLTLRDALRNVPGISIAAGEGGAQGDNLIPTALNWGRWLPIGGCRSR